VISPVEGMRAYPWTSLALIGLCLSLAGCATSGAVTPQDVSHRIQKETGHPSRDAAADPDLPAGVSLEDGLTEQEAVAIALWNNSGFQESLADLGIARAEVVQAGLLRNPVLSLLFPWGPKQLEATVRWPIDALWQRPDRVAAARLSSEAIGERLVGMGLNVVADTRLAYAELLRARQLAALAAENAQLSRRVADLSRSRFNAGDISELEADTADTDAARSELESRRAALEVTLAESALFQLLGLGEKLRPGGLTLADGQTGRSTSCVDVPLTALEQEALASRPDVRAAELDIEAAGRRLGWEQSRIFSLIAILDFNAEGREGAELGPGVETDFGIFDRNQAGVIRATAEMNRARARYQTTRQHIIRDVRDAYSALTTSSAAAVRWQKDVSPRLDRQAGQTQRAYEAGEMSYLAVVESLRRLNEGRISELDAVNATRRALIQLEHRIGRSCTQ
jgi:outer membrane protein, heavy metal efflux system